MRKREGQLLFGVIALLVVLAIIVPAMVRYIQNEAKWSVKQEQNTNAFQIAEAAVDRGYQKIAESTYTWQAIQAGQVQPGFNFDVSYRDIKGGSYAISLTSGPNAGEVTVLTVGRDKANRETRALKVVYSKGGVDSAMYANGISINGSVDVQWGPMKSRGSLILTGSADVDFPRKFAVGAITGWATTSPCTDNLENWAYNCSPGVPPPPSVAIDDYKTIAQATKCPVAWAAGASPAGSCYWPGNAAFNGPVMVHPSSRTIYVHGNMTIQNSFLIGNVIVNGNLDFKGGGKGEYTIPTAGAPAPFTGGIPSTAWREYQKMDTAAKDEYFGDNGYQTLNPTFVFQSGGSTPDKRAGAKNVNPSVRGFVYVGGALSASGGSVVHGVIYSPAGIAGLSGTLSVFYDSNVAAAILTASNYPTRISWLNSRQRWPAALP